MPTQKIRIKSSGEEVEANALVQTTLNGTPTETIYEDCDSWKIHNRRQIRNKSRRLWHLCRKRILLTLSKYFMNKEIMQIGTIGNYYGGLFVRKYKGKYYFGIQDWDKTEWKKISESLYNELINHNEKT